jgi:hypothetical protein
VDAAVTMSRVLLVAGSVGHDESPSRRREVAVGHVDGDHLLALGLETVEEQSEIEVAIACVMKRQGRGQRA